MSIKLDVILDGKTVTIDTTKNLSDLINKLHLEFKDKLPPSFELSALMPDSILISDSKDLETLTNLKLSPLKIQIRSSEKENYLQEFELLEKEEAKIIEDNSTQTNAVLQADIGTVTVPKAETTHIGANTEKTLTKEVAAVAQPDTREMRTQADYTQCFICFQEGPSTSCILCHGTGRLDKSQVQDLINLIRIDKQPIKKKLNLEDSILASHYVASVAKEKELPIIHEGVQCDDCGMTPINGARFKCTLCPNVNLCEACESISTHEHPLIKLKKPEPIPATLYKINKEEPKKYFSKVIEEDLKDGSEIQIKQTFSKTFKLANSGDLPWPKDTILRHDGGHQMMNQEVFVGAIPKNGNTSLKIPLQAFAEPGHYVEFFRLYSDSKPFGQRFWVDVILKEKITYPKLEESSPEDKKMIEIVKKISKANIPGEYLENIVKLLQLFYEADPTTLLSLLKKHKNNLDAAANEILTNNI